MTVILTRNPSPWLFDFLRGYEKFRPTAYKPTKADVWTCGYGHTDGVTASTTCTKDQAESWLRQDVAKRWTGLMALVRVQLTQQQADALGSLVFNIGVGKRDGRKGDFADSTLLELLNAGNFKAAAAEFPKWDHQGGMELEGLRKRRVDEMAHFLSL